MGIGDDELLNPASVSETLRCPICTDVFDEPVFSGGGECQHAFCRPCVDKSLQRDKRCPVCRVLMNPESLHPHQGFQSLLDEVLVRCERSCGWTGRRDARPGHATICPVVRLGNVECMLSAAIKQLDEKDKKLAECTQQLRESNDKLQSAEVALSQLRGLFHNGLDIIAAIPVPCGVSNAVASNATCAARWRGLEPRPSETHPWYRATPRPCTRCGCSGEFTIDGERICWCDACKSLGCMYVEVLREDSLGPVDVPTENSSSVSVHETARARFQDATWRPGAVSLPWRPGQGKGQRNGKGAVQGKGQRSWRQGH